MSEGPDGQRPGAGDGRQHHNRNGNRHRTSEKFTGRSEDLCGFIYDVVTTNVKESFQKTTRAVAEYVARSCENGAEYRLALVELALPEITEPKDPAETATMVQLKKWEIDYEQYKRRKAARQANQGKVFAIILGQCTPAMTDRLHAEPTWETINRNTDVIGLLKLIQSNATVKQAQVEYTHALLDAMTEFTNFRQQQLTLPDYLQGFKDRVDHLERLQGPLGQEELRVQDYVNRNHPDPSKITATELEVAEEACRQAFLATALIFRADKKRYSGLHLEIKNNFTLYKQGYPETLVDAYNTLFQWETADPRVQNGASFLQHDDAEHKGPRRGRGRNGRNSTNASNESTDNKQDSANPDTSAKSDVYLSTRIDVTLHQAAAKAIPESWLILDTASTVDMFLPSMLINIHRSEETLEVVSTGGTTKVREKGTLPGYPVEVWCNRKGVANILSFHNLQKHFRVEYDNKHHDTFMVYVNNGRTLEFHPSENGLYYLKSETETLQAFSLLSTVQANMAQHSTRGTQQAKQARRVQDIIMRPGTRRYKEIVAKSYMRNCPIQIKHIDMAEAVYGPNIGGLKGKTPRRTPAHVMITENPVPPEILKTHGNVSLAVDIMFINKVAFLLTVARGLGIGTVEELDNRQMDNVQRRLSNIIGKYEQRGFKIGTVLADDEFSPLTTLMPTRSFNICGADDHVPEIERFIRTIKDSVRGQYNDLPFSYIPRTVLTRMVRNAVFWWNAFPHEQSDAGVYAPWYLLEGKNIDYKQHVRIPFGAYAQTHEQHDNGMDARTIGAICLGPTGNQQGSHYFFSLSTARVLTRTTFTELPMPQDVIDRVSEIGRQQGMPRSLTFGDRYGHELEDRNGEVDDDHDSDYEYQSDDDDQDDGTAHPDDLTVGTGGHDSDHEYHPDDDEVEHPDDILDHYQAASVEEDMMSVGTDEQNPDTHEFDADILEIAGADQNTEHSTGADENIDADNSLTLNDVAQYAHPMFRATNLTPPDVTDSHSATYQKDEPLERGEPSAVTAPDEEQQKSNMTLRARKPKSNPIHLLGRGFEDAFAFMTAQMTAKKGLEKFGSKGADAIVAEMQQIHYRRVIKPRLAHTLTRDEKRQALRYLMFLKQKRCGRIKARGCADGRKQRLWKTKEETSAPTVRTESVFLSAMIDAKEGRTVITLDVPGAFMQADIDELVVVKFEGELAKLLTKVDPDLYSKFIIQEHGKDVIYVELQKALYGTLQAALLFWKELTRYLVDVLGFELNPYDECVANKTINGKQCTILWHVDDLKLSHVDPAVLEDIVAKLGERFGKEEPLTINRGKVHDYLGMTLDYSVDGKVRIAMDDYIMRMLDELPDDMDGTAATPAANHLFDVNPNTTKLGQDQSDLFHATVAKLLFLCKRARPDIHTAVAFLTTRVVSPDTDDYAKLRRCIRYLRGTASLPLTLEAADNGVLHWWVDASFAVHPDMRSHTGAVLSLGRGAAIGMSTRQKINTKSSTEAELVGVADAMSQIAWVRNFLIAQGFEITDNVIYQDNQSTILLARNGRRSSGKRTRHIDIRYFFVTDRIAQGDVRVEYCPTQQMVADIFTKPLQGSLFRRLRDLVLNVPAPTPDSTNIAESQERVENTDNGWQEGIHRTDIGSQNDYNDKGGRAAAVKSDNKSDTQYGRSDDNCLASAANADPSDSGWTMVKRPTKASTRQKK
jgi:hypothetical protein